MLGFGRRRGSSGSGFLNMPYRGSRMPGEGENAMFNTNRTTPTSGNRVMSTLGPTGSPMTTSRADYGPVLEARRQAKLSSMDPGLSTRGRMNAPGRGSRGPVRGGLETRGVRPAAGTRSAGRPAKMGGPRPAMSRMSAGEFGGGMGMGIPANATAARGSQNIPMLASMPRGQYMSGAEAMGIPANAARGSQNIPMLARPDPVGLNVRRNVAASQQARAAAAKQRDAVAGSRSVIAQMRANSKASVTPVGVGGKRTPVAPVPGAGSGAPPAGALGDKQTNIVRKAIKGFKDMPRGRKALLAGAGAIGLGVLLGNRRERGTSSGAQQGRYGY